MNSSDLQDEQGVLISEHLVIREIETGDDLINQRQSTKNTEERDE